MRDCSLFLSFENVPTFRGETLYLFERCYVPSLPNGSKEKTIPVFDNNLSILDGVAFHLNSLF